MSHLPFTIAAYFFNASAVLVDKFLITSKIKDPLIYIFYFSIFSLIALVILPFTHVPSMPVLILASSSTLLWTTGAYFMFKALQRGLVSRVIPVIGTLIPLILLVVSSRTEPVGINQTWAILVLVAGLVFLTLPDWRGKITKKEVMFELISALFFSASYVILREAYLMDNFLTVFGWSRVVLLPVGLMLVAIPYTRHIVLAKDQAAFKIWSPMGAVFLVGQACGGLAELLLTFSVSLANPALVNSIQGVQYVFLLGMSLILAQRWPQIYKEKVGRWSLVGKLIGLVLIAFGLYILAFSEVKPNTQVGVTYSPRYASELGLEPVSLFPRMIDDLGIKSIRFPVYWDEVETKPGVYDFSLPDQYLNVAQQKGVTVILGLGAKQPRWPECFAPEWAMALTPSERQAKLLELVRREVEHFGSFSAVKIWQVENEPYFNFGKCGALAEELPVTLPQEIKVVKSIDQRPIMVTDSGELTSWIDSMKQADIFGASLYRTVWNPYFGLVDYPLAPVMYLMKAQLAQLLAGHRVQGLIISELQTEPWSVGNKTLPETAVNEQLANFSANSITKNYKFAQETGFQSIYLWGVEWWYFMDKVGHPEFLAAAKQVFNSAPSQ